MVFEIYKTKLKTVRFVKKAFIFALNILCTGLVFAGEISENDHIGVEFSIEQMPEGSATTETIEDEKDTSIISDFYLELDPYYSSAGLYTNLGGKTVPDLGKQSEAEIYRQLLFSSNIPSFFVIEASINPLPLMGVWLKKDHSDFYNSANVTQDLNLIESITAGFEEPWAASLFLGKVVKFTPPDEQNSLAANRGYTGLLASVGNYHIKNNVMIPDYWYELEYKLKGDRRFSSQLLYYSFRIGAKIHANEEITDVMYVSFKRSRLDYLASGWDVLKNSGFEYTFDFDFNFSAVQHYFTIDKKWPVKNYAGFVLELGFIWQSGRKYSGSLANADGENNMEYIIRPLVQF